MAEIITHPQYKTSPVPTNDFALLRLGQCQDFNKGVAPACLPADNSRDFAGSVATVTGWGKLRSGGDSPRILQEVDLDVMANAECKGAYGSGITGEMICASRKGKDSCQGDSGGKQNEKMSELSQKSDKSRTSHDHRGWQGDPDRGRVLRGWLR